MKLLKKEKGKVSLKLENLDDIWIVSKIIKEKDIVGSKTTRVVKLGNKEERKKMYIKIEVEKVNYDGKSLRVLGQIVECSNPDVPLRDYHTLEFQEGSIIDIYRDLSISEIQRIKDAEEASKRPKMLLCVADYGEYTFALLKEFGIEYLTDVEKALPGKRKGYEKEYEKARKEFLEDLAKTIEEMLKTYNVEKVIFGGVGFLSDDLSKLVEKKYPQLKGKIIFSKVSVPGKTGINELFKRGTVNKVLEGNRVAEESEKVEKLFEEISKDGAVAYGLEETEKALDYGAVEILLISEKFIEKEKEKAEELMEKAKKISAKVLIISEKHEAGEKFADIGIGALLRFKV